MADTGSEGADTAGSAGAAPELRHPRRRVRLTLRLRLTLLYGACFVVAAAALLGVTYAVFTGSQQRVTIVGSLKAVPRSLGRGAAISLSAHGGGASVRVVHASGGGTKPPSRRQVEVIQKRLQRQSRKQIAFANFLLSRQRTGDASALLEISAIALGAIALLAVGLAWLVAGRALRPLRTMNARAREITEESLHARLGLDSRDDELGELAATFDALLARLERAFESQRLFVANASHELRTPLTLERALVEVALADPEASMQSLRHACERVLVSTEQQERLIDALLTLARSQADVADHVAVDLAAAVADQLAARESGLAEIAVTAELGEAIVSGDPALLERLIGNLLDNAIVHRDPHNPWIRVQTSTEDDGVVVLRVANSGQVVPPERVDELFEPFRRLERTRTVGQGGLGLGLSIVRAVAVAHGAAIDAQPLEGGGLSVELRLRPTEQAPVPR